MIHCLCLQLTCDQSGTFGLLYYSRLEHFLYSNHVTVGLHVQCQTPSPTVLVITGLPALLAILTVISDITMDVIKAIHSTHVFVIIASS